MLEWTQTEYLSNLEYGKSFPPLHHCAHKGFLKECKELLDQEDTDVNLRDMRKSTALHLAQSPEIVRLLLENGADFRIKNFVGQTALHHAAIVGAEEKIKLLLDAGASVNDNDNENGMTPLHYTAETCLSSVRILELLVEHGADINARTRLFKETPLHLAAASDNTELGKRLLEMGACVNSVGFQNNTPLFTSLEKTLDLTRAILHGQNTGMVEILLEYGADVNIANSVTGRTPLHIAGENCTGEIIKLLLAKGANPNARDGFGRTPLMAVAGAPQSEDETELTNQKEPLEDLLSQGAEINAQDMTGYCALSHAFGKSNEAAMLFLMSRGADVTLKDRFGASAIHYATSPSLGDFLKELIDTKPDLNVRERDIFGSTPLHWAAWYGSDEAIDILMEKGALKDDIDHGGHTPADVARLKGNDATLKLLGGDSDTTAQTAGIVGIETQFGDYYDTFFLPPNVSLEHCTCAADVLEVIANIPDTNQFLLAALHKPGIGIIPDCKESDQVLRAVTTLVQAVVDKVGQLDERFACSLVPSGSAHEGTKCRFPDEFDFLCCLDKLSQWCESDESTSPAGFTTIKKKRGTLCEEGPFAEFFEDSGLLNVASMNEVFYYLALEAVCSLKDLWLLPELQFAMEEEILQNENPSCIMRLQWRGQMFKDMGISIDLVPALKLNQWPHNAIKSTSLLKGNLESHGFHAVVKEPTVGTCDLEENPDYTDFMRISFSQLETSIFRSLPQYCREALTLMKTIRFLCNVVVEDFPQPFCNDVSSLITTHMFKTLLFIVLDKSGVKQLPEESAGDTTLRLAREVFKELERAFEEESMFSFFLPLNLLEAPPALAEERVASTEGTDTEDDADSKEDVKSDPGLKTITPMKLESATLAATEGDTLAPMGGATLAPMGGATLAPAEVTTLAAIKGDALAPTESDIKITMEGATLVAPTEGNTRQSMEGATLATTGDSILAANEGATLAPTGSDKLAATEGDSQIPMEDAAASSALTDTEEELEPGTYPTAKFQFKRKLGYQLKLVRMVNKLYFKQ